jgi:hypothetical protein
LDFELFVVLLLISMLRLRDLLVEDFAVELVALQQFLHLLVPLQENLHSSSSIDQLNIVKQIMAVLTRNARWTLSKVKCM